MSGWTASTCTRSILASEKCLGFTCPHDQISRHNAFFGGVTLNYTTNLYVHILLSQLSSTLRATGTPSLRLPSKQALVASYRHPVVPFRVTYSKDTSPTGAFFCSYTCSSHFERVRCQVNIRNFSIRWKMHPRTQYCGATRTESLEPKSRWGKPPSLVQCSDSFEKLFDSCGLIVSSPELTFLM